MRLSLRARLLAAFVSMTVLPILVLGYASAALISRSSERAAGQRLEAALRSAREEIARRERRAGEEAELIVRDDLPSEQGDDVLELASRIALKRRLDVLEVLDADGRVVSSHHWKAGFGFIDRDFVFPGQDALRLETVAKDYGADERLAVTAARSGRWRDRPVTVRAGWYADAAFAAELSALMGLEVALRDDAHGRWLARPDTPLSAWRGPALQAGRAAEVWLADEAYRWQAESLAPGLWILVALPRASVGAVAADVRRLSLALAAAALLVALVAAVIVSGRIAQPVRELAEGARRVASGDLGRTVDIAGRDEIGDLARSFNAMTAELRDSRDRLLQAERVAAWREMARRLAHELKNPIFPIQLSIETLRRVLDQEERGQAGAGGPGFAALFRESSDTILEELRSLRSIIEEFSQFARMPRPRLQPTDVNTLVEQALALYRSRANGVVIETDLSAALPLASADRDLLGRALTNLIANAFEAMPEGGTLRVRTAAEPPGVSVQVEDTGPGLTDDQRTRLFTPYYTTKRGGTGLGLAIVQGIISDHGGRVQVKSEPGHGTTFTLLLPAAS